jgi:hypothetical protein
MIVTSMKINKEESTKKHSTIHELVNTDNRYNYICDYLYENDVKFNTHKFQSVFGEGKNIVVEINNKAKESILISTHYDDNGIYDNCGGVLQLLMLSKKLTAIDSSIHNYNYIIIFTDQEEKFQQGVFHFLKSNLTYAFKYHLNIDGIGIGKELILYNSIDGHLIIDWLNKQEKVILLTDNSPFTSNNIDSFHLFSCYKQEADEIVTTQKFHNGFLHYFNEEWCVQNFNESLFDNVYLSKILNFLFGFDSEASIPDSFHLLK